MSPEFEEIVSSESLSLTAHARTRLKQRGIGVQAAALAIIYGRTVSVHGITFHVVGKREVEKYERMNIDLATANGVHVLTADDGAIVTAYRSHELKPLRLLKRRYRRTHH